MPEQYIFNGDAQDLFYEKLEGLHEEYVYHLLLTGVAGKGLDLESIKMTKAINVSHSHCEKVVGGLLNIKPHVVARLVEDGATTLECIFTKVNNGKDLNYLYMIQNVMDWPLIGHFSCQIWYLGETSVREIKEHWNA